MKYEICDFLAPELDAYARMSEAELLHHRDPEPGWFIAESPHVIERALNAGYQPISFLMENREPDAVTAAVLARCPDIPIYTSEFSLLTKLTGFKLTRGLLCLMQRPKLPDMKEMLKNATRVAVLEDVVNPTNVGAIIRSAAALGMDAVLLTPACSDPLYRRASRVSMGTVFQIPWTYTHPEPYRKHPATDAPSYVEVLQSLGFTTAAMALEEESVSIDHPALQASEKLAVILGTEGEGLKAQTIQQCDYTVMIPMSHGVDSLNVAAASAVAFWAVGKK